MIMFRLFQDKSLTVKLFLEGRPKDFNDFHGCDLIDYRCDLANKI